MLNLITFEKLSELTRDKVSRAAQMSLNHRDRKNGIESIAIMVTG